MSRLPSKRRNAQRPKSTVATASPEKTSKKLAPKTDPEVAAPTWENIVLHYLSKLRGFLRPTHQSCRTAFNSKNHPVAGTRQTSVQFFQRVQSNFTRDFLEKSSVKPMEPDPDKYSSKCRQILNRQRSATAFSSAPSEAGTSSTSIRAARKVKASKIVSAAIDYGCASGIIRSNGRYFWFKEKNARIRSPTPFARKLCKLCSGADSRPSFARKRSRSISSDRSVSQLRENQEKRKDLVHGASIQLKKARKEAPVLRSRANKLNSSSSNKCSVEPIKRLPRRYQKRHGVL